MFEVYLSIGSNLGDRFKNVINSLIEIEKIGGTTIDKISSLYETEPYGNKDQKEFLNLVVKLDTNKELKDFFYNMKAIEQKLGRTKKAKWLPREIDIDILFFGDMIYRDDEIQIPHYDLHNRRFVLEPLCEIEREYIHPRLKKNLSEILSELKDTSAVRRLN